jgi:amino acid permease
LLTRTCIIALVGLPFFFLFFIIWKIVKRTKFVSAKEADLDTGRSVAIEEVEGEQTKKKWWTKVISVLA